ncbi:hypothetical protein EBB54_16385 [Schaedlerella arabinosiphila]|uniref:Uncharacterized protein n=1 Tax=Schaedlerella arabinosiphila TaxID=2044587 RepID=A0A3R8JPW8_9FIRM|nr:hypothetical protein EBB54_16385 [Schaedlerella arabinosiphila]
MLPVPQLSVLLAPLLSLPLSPPAGSPVLLFLPVLPLPGLLLVPPGLFPMTLPPDPVSFRHMFRPVRSVPDPGFSYAVPVIPYSLALTPLLHWNPPTSVQYSIRLLLNSPYFLLPICCSRLPL